MMYPLTKEQQLFLRGMFRAGKGRAHQATVELQAMQKATLLSFFLSAGTLVIPGPGASHEGGP